MFWAFSASPPCKYFLRKYNLFMSSLEIKRFVEETASEKDKAAFQRSEELSVPRAEYKDRKINLDYSYQFSTGDTFIAKEDKKAVRIGIKKKDGSWIDFEEKFLSKGFRFATPALIHISTPGYEYAGNWVTELDRKFVSVGDMRAPDAIIALLHEAAHTHQESLQEKFKRELGAPLSAEEFIKPNLAIAERYAKGASNMERNAWAEAICSLRWLKRHHQIDVIKEALPTPEDFKRVMYAMLVNHRIAHQMNVSGEAYVDMNIGEFVGRIFGYKAERKVARRVKERLFDKGKLEKL